jgi:hypothetical protein
MLLSRSIASAVSSAPLASRRPVEVDGKCECGGVSQVWRKADTLAHESGPCFQARDAPSYRLGRLCRPQRSIHPAETDHRQEPARQLGRRSRGDSPRATPATTNAVQLKYSSCTFSLTRSQCKFG